MLQPKKASITQRWRLPSICFLCHQYHIGRFAICTECDKRLTPLGPACQYCALPLPESHFLICGPCSQKKPHFDQVMAAYRFEEPLRTLLHEFKYHEGLYLGPFLAELMLNVVSTDLKQSQCLIPVPMHPKRLRQRGFNPAVELAKYLARSVNMPVDWSVCKKVNNTAPQANLDAKQRRQNLRHSFAVKPNTYQHITIIDDLITTGSTANEMAKALKKQGVARVDVWCCGRATIEFRSRNGRIWV